MTVVKNKKRYGHGDFGNLAKKYDEARQGFPKEVIDCLWTKVKQMTPYILDVGCGTGIPTRQLVDKGAVVIGSDKDAQMIKMAMDKPLTNLIYVTAPTGRLPFLTNTFDIVTAFSALHWFADNDSVQEMYRVLKIGGIVFVANKNEAGNFKQGYKAVLKPFITRDLPDVKKDYSPRDLLMEANFLDVEERSFQTSEFFTLPQVIAYLQSVSIWNLVPESLKPEALAALEKYCRGGMVNGAIERKLEVMVVCGRK